MKRFLTKLQGIVWLSRAKKLGLSYHQIVILIVISLIATVTEVIGIGIFLPIFQFIRLEGDLNALVGSSIFWQYLIDWFAYFNIETSLVVLLLVSFSFFMFNPLRFITMSIDSANFLSLEFSLANLIDWSISFFSILNLYY